ncbi:MAG: hypothetical protein HS108_01125 [Planctomycetes bacterium]|nr:hypothetical protein [Planctomycetota bacterium]
MNEPDPSLVPARAPLLTPLEHEELLGGLRTLAPRLAVGGVTTLLLYLCGDMVGWWPLCWLALVPLSLACRGAGPVAALLVALPVLGAANVAQTLWLLDGPESPWPLWLAATLLPALAYATVELPFCTTRLPWTLRPAILGLALVGALALIPPAGGMLVPLGGLIDSELARPAYAKLGLAAVAGVFAALAWLAAELCRVPGRKPWAGAALVAALAVLAGVDVLGARDAAGRYYAGDPQRIVVVPAGPDMDRATRDMLGPDARGALVLWGVTRAADDAAQAEVLARAGEVSDSLQCALALVIAQDTHSTGYLFLRSRVPQAQRRWQGAPGELDGDPLVVDGPGVLTLHPALIPPQAGTAHHDVQLCTTARRPLHPAEAAWWLREQRRGALVRHARQACVWDGGGAIITWDGHVLARSGGEPIDALVTPAERLGEAMGKPRLMVAEKILRFAAPTLALTLAVLSVVAWAKRRWRARREAPADIAIEEVYDGQ